MKKLLFIVAAFVLCACQTTGQTVQLTAKTPAQIAADVCPPIQAALDVLATLGALDPAAQEDMVTTAQAVSLACSLGDAAQAADLHVLAQGVIPFMVKNVALLAIPEPQKQEVILALAVAKAALAAVR